MSTSLSHLTSVSQTLLNYFTSLHDLKSTPPVTDVATKHLGEAVAPEEAAQHHPRLPLAPAELLGHADGTDRHGHAGAVEEACPEEQHHRPYPRHRPAQEDKEVSWVKLKGGSV